MQMKMVVVDKDIVVNLNKQYFLLHILQNEKFVINDLSWNYRYLEGYEDILILYNTEVYYGEWVDSNIVLHQVIDYDKLVNYLFKMFPQTDKYFYLLTSKFILTLPKELLIQLPLVDDPLITKYYRVIN